MKNFHGSYKENDVNFLLKIIDIEELDVLEKEKLLQKENKHYSEMITKESLPNKKYLDLFYYFLEKNSLKMANDIMVLAQEINKIENPIIVSLARAGTPIGVLLKRTLEKYFNKETEHFSVSIIINRGIDKNAISFINKKYPNHNIVFIDGWTAKGTITKELRKSINEYNNENNLNISDKLFVLSDLSGKADFSATYEDYLIPSSILNSIVSGLISRTILNENVKENDFHACKYYKEFEENDLSLKFIDFIMDKISNINIDKLIYNNIHDKNKIIEENEKFISFLMDKYNIKNINFIKPGIGETTRVLLRRIPERIIIKDINDQEVKPILILAEEKNINIEFIKDIPYKAIGIISDLKNN